MKVELPNAPAPIKRRGFSLILAVILLSAALLRLSNLGTPPIKEDEAYHAVVASTWAETGSPVPPSGIPYIRGLPLVVLDVLALHVFPSHLEFAVRLPTALLGVLNVWLIFLLARRSQTASAALLLASLYAVASWTVHLGTLARMYEILATASLLAVLTLQPLVHRPTWGRAAVFMAVVWGAIACHNLGVFLLILPVLALVTGPQRRRLAPPVVLMSALTLAFYVVYPPAMRALLRPPGPALDTGGRIPEVLLLPDLEWQRQVFAAAGLVWVIMVIALVGASVLFGRRIDRSLRVAAMPWLAGIVLLGSSGFLMLAAMVAAAAVAHSLAAADVERARRVRWAMVVALGAVAGSWVAIALAAALADGGAVPERTIRIIKDASIYPAPHWKVIPPLLLNPDTIVWVYACGAVALWFGAAVLVGRRLPGDRPLLAAKLMFLIAVVAAFSLVEKKGLAARYVYFLFPIALLAMGELVGLLLTGTSRWVRRSVVALALVLTVAVELPASVGLVPDAAGQRRYRGPVAWLPDHETRENLVGVRDRDSLDYRSAGAFIRSQRAVGDLVLADAAHQMQVYLERIDGSLSPELPEYRTGTYHYFTGSRLLRQPADLHAFLAAHREAGHGRVWVVITDYRSVWTRELKPLLAGHEVWRQDRIGVYRVPVDELLDTVAAMREIDTVSVR